MPPLVRTTSYHRIPVVDDDDLPVLEEPRRLSRDLTLSRPSTPAPTQTIDEQGDFSEQTPRTRKVSFSMPSKAKTVVSRAKPFLEELEASVVSGGGLRGSTQIKVGGKEREVGEKERKKALRSTRLKKWSEDPDFVVLCRTFENTPAVFYELDSANMGVMGSVPEDQENHSPSNSPGSNSSPHSPGRLPRPRSSRAYPTFTSNLTPSVVRMAESGFMDVERRKAEGTAIRMVQKYLESDSYTTATAWTSQLTTKSKTESTPPCSPGIPIPARSKDIIVSASSSTSSSSSSFSSSSSSWSAYSSSYPSPSSSSSDAHHTLFSDVTPTKYTPTPLIPTSRKLTPTTPSPTSSKQIHGSPTPTKRSILNSASSSYSSTTTSASDASIYETKRSSNSITSAKQVVKPIRPSYPTTLEGSTDFWAPKNQSVIRASATAKGRASQLAQRSSSSSVRSSRRDHREGNVEGEASNDVEASSKANNTFTAFELEGKLTQGLKGRPEVEDTYLKASMSTDRSISPKHSSRPNSLRMSDGPIQTGSSTSSSSRPSYSASSSRSSYPKYEPRVPQALSAARAAARTAMAGDHDLDSVAVEWANLTRRLRDQNAGATPRKEGIDLDDHDRARPSRPQPRPEPRVAEKSTQGDRVRTSSMLSVFSTTTTATASSNVPSAFQSTTNHAPINAFKSGRTFVSGSNIQPQTQSGTQTRTSSFTRTRTFTRIRSHTVSDPVVTKHIPESQPNSGFESEFEKAFPKLEKQLGKLTLEVDDDDEEFTKSTVGSGIYLLNQGSRSIERSLEANGSVDRDGVEGAIGEGFDQDVGVGVEGTDSTALARADAQSQVIQQAKIQPPPHANTHTSLMSTNTVSPVSPPPFDPSAPDTLHLRHLKRLEAEALRREEAADEQLKGLGVSPSSGRRTFQRTKRSSLGGGNVVGTDGWWDGDDDGAFESAIRGSDKTFSEGLKMSGEDINGQEHEDGDVDFDWDEDGDGEKTVGPEDIVGNLSDL